METLADKVEIAIIKHEGRNLTLSVRKDNVVAIFRLHYEDRTRKNARHDDFKVTETYFEGFENLPNKQNHFLSYPTSGMTDLCLFVERKSQWIMEQAKNKEGF